MSKKRDFTKTSEAFLKWAPTLIPKIVMDRAYEHLDEKEQAALTDIRQRTTLTTTMAFPLFCVQPWLGPVMPAMNGLSAAPKIQKKYGSNIYKRLAQVISDSRNEIAEEIKHKAYKKPDYNGPAAGFFQRNIVELFPMRQSFNKTIKEAALNKLDAHERDRVKHVSEQRGWNLALGGAFGFSLGPAGPLVGAITFAIGEAQLTPGDRAIMAKYRAHVKALSKPAAAKPAAKPSAAQKDDKKPGDAKKNDAAKADKKDDPKTPPKNPPKNDGGGTWTPGI